MAVAQHLPEGRRQAGDRHLKFHDAGGNLRGIVTGEIKAVNKGVQHSSVADPEGSQITLIGNFRIRY